MNTSSNSLREDKTNGASDKALSETTTIVHLYCDSDRQSHNNDAHVPLAASLKSKEHVDEFIAFLAHEVRNPLTNINLSTEMLDAAIEDEELKSYVAIISRSSSRINDLITRLLNYQKPDEEDEVKSSINHIVNEVMEIMDDRIRLKNITVVKNFSTEDFFILSNRAKIKIAITNIVANAIDAMPVANGLLKLNTKLGGTEYLVEIEDNGCGISKENLQSIFNTGFTNKPGGLGFGLQITKVILQSNNVEIKVASNEGKGTKFTLLFNKN